MSMPCSTWRLDALGHGATDRIQRPTSHQNVVDEGHRRRQPERAAYGRAENK